MKQFILGFVVILLLFGICVFGKGISVYNTHIDLKTKIEAQQKSNEANFDTMWKKISQVSQVSDKYKAGLTEVLNAYTSGRKTDSDQLLMNWIKEAVPTFDSSIYKQINNIVVSSRDDFFNNQKILIDLSRQHNQFIQKFPNNLFCGILNIQPIEIKVITSTKTEKTFESGKEDDIKI